MPDALAANRTNPNSKGRVVSFSKGANLYDSEHPPRLIYVLSAGQVRLAHKNGVIFDHLKRGYCLGEKAFWHRTTTGKLPRL